MILGNWGDGIMGCFNPCFSGCLSSIVVIDGKQRAWYGFNPCFSGCLSSILLVFRLRIIGINSFNPCFSGCLSSIDHGTFYATQEMVFQSLF